MSMLLCFLLFQRHADTHFRSWPTAAAIAALKIAGAKIYTLLHHVNVPVFSSFATTYWHTLSIMAYGRSHRSAEDSLSQNIHSITSPQCSCVFFFCNDTLTHTHTHTLSWPTAATIRAKNAFGPIYRIMRDLHLKPITKYDMKMMWVLTSLSLPQKRAMWP